MVIRNASNGDRQMVTNGTLFDLFNLTDELLALIDEEGRFVRLNEALVELLGVADKDHRSALYLDYVYAEDRPETEAALQQVAAGEQVTVVNYFRAGSGDFRRIRWRLGTSNGLILVVGRRLGETRPLPARVAEQRQLLAVLEAAPDIIGIADVDGSIRYVNPAGREILGYGLDEDLSDKTMMDFVPEWAAEIVLHQGIPTAVRTGKWIGEVAFYDAAGKERPVSQLIISHRDARGKVVRFSTIVRDMSERKEVESRLERQAQQLALVTEVSAVATTILDVDKLLRRVVDLMRARFNLYHAHIYLLNAAKNTLLLAAGAGEIGQQMVAEGRSIPIDAARSLVARVARNRAGLIVNDVRREPDFLPHPLLPETKAEMAVPVMTGNNLVGVLDVQADEANRFSEMDISIQTALAAQVAIAIENARSFGQAQQAVAELDALTRRLTREGWENYMAARAREEHGFLYDASQIQPVVPLSNDRRATKGVAPATNDHPQPLTQPLEVHGATVGHLALEGAPDAPDLDEEAAAIVAAVAGQLSARIENLRLTEQTQDALMSTERQAQRLASLNELAAALGAAATQEEIFETTATRANEIIGGERASIALLTEDKAQLQLFALEGTVGGIPTGTPVPVTGTAVAQVLKDRRLLYQTDLRHHDYVENEALVADGLRSTMMVPLFGREDMLGTLNVGSESVAGFTIEDQNLLRQLSALLAAIIESRNLSAKTEQHAAQLEVLAEVEAALSQAATEEELLAAIAPYFVGDDPQATLILNFLETDDSGQPARASAVAVWQEGGIQRDSHLLERTLFLPEYPVAELWIDEPFEPLFVENMQDDARTDARMRAQANALDFQASAVIPLYSGRRWQGNLLFFWPEPHRFSGQEQFLIRQLVEPLSATIASRRANLAQQEALTETAALYRAGSELNRARTFEDVLEVLRRNTMMGEMRAVSALMLFDSAWTDSAQPEWIEIAASWEPESGSSTLERFRLADLPTLRELLRPDAPLIIEDARTDEQIGDDLRQFFVEPLNSCGMIIVPVVVGGQWIGCITSLFPDKALFSETEYRRLITLVGQAAVAVQSINLLAETNRLLASEQRQRRIADTMLRATERMSGILDEAQIREIMVDEIHNLLRPAQVGLYQWVEAEESFRVLNQVGVPGARKPRYSVGRMVPAGEAPELWRVYEEGQPRLEVAQEEVEDRREAYRFNWLVGNEFAGVMEVLRPAGATTMRDEDRASVIGMVQQAAIRLQNARLFEESEMRAEELAVLNEMGRALTALTDVEAVIEAVYQYTSHLMDTTNFYVGLYDSEQKMLAFPLAVDRNERVYYPARSYGAGMTEHLIERREPLLLSDNVSAYLTSVGIEQYGEEARSWLGVPLVYGDQVLGVIALQSYTQAHAYNEHSLELLGSIASQAAIAIQNANLFQEIQERVAETETLYEASRAINTSQRYEDILETLRAFTFLGQADHLSLNYFDRPWSGATVPEVIHVLARRTHLPPQVLQSAYDFGTFPSRRYLEKENPVLIEDVATSPIIDDQLRALLQTMQAASTLFVPLVAGGQWLGFIHGVYREPVEFPEDAVERLTTLTGQAAVAIQGLHLLQEAQGRVRRERILREVTSSVRSVTDVELILKTAARQVGQALGRETFVYLGDGVAEAAGDGAAGSASESQIETSTPLTGEEGR